MLENRSPRRIYSTILASGVLLGMALDQFIWGLAGERASSLASSLFPAMFAILVLPIGWRMLASLPWSTINDPARYEYRSPSGPTATAGDGAPMTGHASGEDARLE